MGGAPGAAGGRGAGRAHRHPECAPRVLERAGSTPGGLLVTAILDRYRLLLVTPLALYAGAGLGGCVHALRERNPRPAALLASLTLLVAVGQQWLAPIPELRRSAFFTLFPPAYTVAAQVYAREGRFERALGELHRLKEKALRLGFPAQAHEASQREGSVRLAWARHLLAQGALEEARHQAHLAEQAYGAPPEGREASYALGVWYSSQGEGARARAFLERFLTLEPQGPRAQHARSLLAGLGEQE